jgi:type I restriction enzyme S subunit
MSDAASRKDSRTFRFDEIATIVNDRVDDPSEANVDYYVGLEHLDSDSLTIQRWGSPADVEATKLRFRAGDIIFGRRRVYQRKLGVAHFDGICSAHAMVLRAKPDVVVPGFLPFFMQSDLFMERAKEISVGSLSPTINWKTLAKEEFALPHLDEQRRVADVLREAESLIQSLRTLGHSLHATANALVEDTIQRAPNNALERVAELLIEPPRNGVSPAANAEGTGLRTVSISAVSAGVFEPSGCIKHAHIDPSAARPFFVRQGDVFVIRGNGNRHLCGKAGLTDRSYDDLFYPDLLIRLRFDPKKILPEFAVTQWNLPSVHARLSARAKSSNGIWKVNGQDIRAHRLFAPSVDKQKDLMESVTKLRLAAGDAAERAKAAGGIKATVLSKAAGV